MTTVSKYHPTSFQEATNRCRCTMFCCALKNSACLLLQTIVYIVIRVFNITGLAVDQLVKYELYVSRVFLNSVITCGFFFFKCRSMRTSDYCRNNDSRAAGIVIMQTFFRREFYYLNKCLLVINLC